MTRKVLPCSPAVAEAVVRSLAEILEEAQQGKIQAVAIALVYADGDSAYEIAIGRYAKLDSLTGATTRMGAALVQCTEEQTVGGRR